MVTFSLALSLMLLANWINSREFVLARNSNVFLLAKWIDEGPALAYLKKACPAEGYALCAYLPELEGKTHDALKWGRNSPFAKVGTFDELEPEAHAIVRAILYSYPYDIVRKALTDFVLQLSRFGAGEGSLKTSPKWLPVNCDLFMEAPPRLPLSSRGRDKIGFRFRNFAAYT